MPKPTTYMGPVAQAALKSMLASFDKLNSKDDVTAFFSKVIKTKAASFIGLCKKLYEQLQDLEKFVKKYDPIHFDGLRKQLDTDLSKATADDCPQDIN